MYGSIRDTFCKDGGGIVTPTWAQGGYVSGPGATGPLHAAIQINHPGEYRLSNGGEVQRFDGTTWQNVDTQIAEPKVAPKNDVMTVWFWFKCPHEYCGLKLAVSYKQLEKGLDQKKPCPRCKKPGWASTNMIEATYSLGTKYGEKPKK